jgi:hypothetical protein
MKAVLFLAGAMCAFAQNPLTDVVKTSFESGKNNLIGAAAAMPETDYGFRLTPVQRPFGEWIEHTAEVNYRFCSAIKGVKAPLSPAAHATSKAELQKRLQESFDFCDSVFKDVTDQKAMTAIDSGGKESYPVTSMVILVGGLNEHYGNLVGYLRTKGITPPSTARSQKKS